VLNPLHMLISLLLILHLGTPFSFASSAENLTLKQALSEGAQGSLVLQKSKSVAEEASWKRVESYSGFLPTLGLQMNYLTKYRYLLTDINFGGNPTSVPAVIPTSNLLVTAQWPLFDGLASTNRYWSAKNMEDAAKNEHSWAVFQSQMEIALQFYKTLGAQDLKNVAEQNLKALQDHLRDIKLFKKAGVSTNFDVLKVEVQVSEAQSELLNAVDNIAVQQTKLAEVLGKDSEPRSLIGSLPVLSTDLIKDVSDTPYNEKADLQALRQRTEGISDLSTANGRYWVPKISAFGQYQYYNNVNDRFNDWERFREAYSVGVSLNWNLFDGLVSQARNHQTLEQKYQAEKTLKQSEIKAKQDLAIWKRKFIYFATVYRAKTQDVEKAQEAVRLAKVGMKVGSRTNTDLLDAESELFRAKAASVNAQIGTIDALVKVQLASGRRLIDFN
jgi:outer membrane protein TolC